MKNKKEAFKILNSFFDQVYVITLEKNKNRHSLISRVLNGLDYEVFWGVDGDQLEYDKIIEDHLYHPYLTKILKKRKGKTPGKMSLPRIGCALSHLKVCQEVINKNYKKVLILEDDPLLNLNNIDSLKNAFDELPNNWELLYLGNWGSNTNPSLFLRFQKTILLMLALGFQKFERLKMIDSKVINCSFPRPYSNNLEMAGYHHGAYAYGVTLEGAKKILNYQLPVVQEYDNALGELCSYEWINAFSLKNHLFLPNRELPSTINKNKIRFNVLSNVNL